MKQPSRFGAMLMAWGSLAGVSFATERSDFQSQVAVARDAVLPHVVSILVVREDFSQSEAKLSLSGGSGTVIDPRGYVLTNAHVTENGRRFRVVMNDGREFRASLRGDDPISDLAVLQIEAQDVRFGAASFAKQVDLQAGETVLAMGAPWGMRDSLSAGVVSNPKRLMVSLFEDEADYEQSLGPEQATARYYAWIQHDASINPGNSGGPLVSLSGEIVGVNTRGNMFGGDMAFAIPSPVAEKVARAIIDQGEVQRSDFGFAVRSVRGTDFTRGALVNSVDRASLAEKAGLRAGDHIIALDGEEVNLLEPEAIPEFRRKLSERPVGSQIKLSIERAGTPQELAFASIEHSEKKAPELELVNLGLSVSNLTLQASRARYLDKQQGAVIVGVRPGGPASNAQPPLASGDLILSLDGKTINNAEELAALASKQSERWLAVAFDRRGNKMAALIRPGPKFVVPEQQNELVKSWAGIEVQPITPPMASGLGLSGAGFRVIRVYPKGPADNAGLKVGDLIQDVDGIKVLPSGQKETTALDVRIRNASTEKPLKVGLSRSGTRFELALSLIEQPVEIDKAKRRWIELLKVRVRELTLYDRVERNLANETQGVVLDQVESGGYGGLAHLKERDLIVRIDGEPVAHIDDLETQLERSRKRGAGKISFLVMRGADTRLLFVDAPWRELVMP
jgi:serine protease Do